MTKLTKIYIVTDTTLDDEYARIQQYLYDKYHSYPTNLERHPDRPPERGCEVDTGKSQGGKPDNMRIR